MTRCLVLDHNPLAAAALVRQIRDLGIQRVETVTTGRQALDRLAAAGGDIDLMFCDLATPCMDGVEIIRNIAEVPVDAPVFVPMGQAPLRLLHAASALARARGLRVAGPLPRPVRPEALRDILAALPHCAPIAGPKSRPHPPHLLQPSELEEAMAEGRLIPWFQPKIYADTGALSGFEALARIVTRDGTVLSPAAFLPTVNNCFMARSFVQSMARNVAHWMSVWRSYGYPLQVSINVWPSCLDSLDMCDILTDIFAERGIPARDVILEVTEADVAVRGDNMLDNLTRLRLRGFGVSIDDFGTGHSSLEKLRDFPFTELKIDQSFVRGAQTDPVARCIVGWSAALARAIDMTAVAEGVETEEDAALMREFGVDVLQGYLISRPLPPEDVLKSVLSYSNWCPAGNLSGLNGRDLLPVYSSSLR